MTGVIRERSAGAVMIERERRAVEREDRLQDRLPPSGVSQLLIGAPVGMGSIPGRPGNADSRPVPWLLIAVGNMTRVRPVWNV